MAIARTGVYIDDYLEYANTLPAELQRLLNTIRELDDRSQSTINQTRQQTKQLLGLSSQSSKKATNNGNKEEDEAAVRKMHKDIEDNQENALSLCTEKVLLAQQAYDLLCKLSCCYCWFFIPLVKQFKHYLQGTALD